MLFSELYSAYYNAMAAVIAAAVDHKISSNEIWNIVQRYAFGESTLNVEPAIKEGRWQLIKPDGTTPIKNVPTMPLTTLQKRWLNAIALDPRMKLFTDDVLYFPDVDPLFTPDDIYVYDRYADGDDYTDEEYISNFRLIRDAIKSRTPLYVESIGRKGTIIKEVVVPQALEYSQKDDKFRVICDIGSKANTINLGRITKCAVYTGRDFRANGNGRQEKKRSVTFELINERNALDRILMHFAHLEKKVVKLDDLRYEVTVTYSKEDESEMVIRILSFGPMIKVTAPGHFTGLIRERLEKQMKFDPGGL